MSIAAAEAPVARRTVDGALSAQTFQRRRLRERISEIARRTWAGLGSWDDRDVDRLLATLVPLVEAGQVQVAALTDAYLAEVVGSMTGATVRPAGVSREDVTGVRGVPAAEVYRRPFVEVWTGLKAGVEFSRALQTGQDRLLRLVEDDLSLAHRQATSSLMGFHGAVRYRRVIRPELALSGTCGLCIAAASQTYSSGRLMPIHTRCHCEALPILGDQDPARSFNDEDSKAAYARVRSVAGSAAAEDLKKVRFEVKEHGELGPVLRLAGSKFTGPGDLAG